MSKRFLIWFMTSGVMFLVGVLPGLAAEKEYEDFICGTLHPDSVNALLQDAIRRGELTGVDKWLKTPFPQVTPASHDSITPKTPITPADIFLYEDVNQRLVNPFSFGTLFNLMRDAANALITRDGDQWDYIAFWCSFTPHPASQVGAAFYSGIKNDVDGIGLTIFDNHSGIGLLGTKTMGFVQMWNIAGWDADSSDLADFTQLVMGQEFEHRWGMFLDPTDNGVQLQGTDVVCGRSAHWNFRIDLQGSGMEAQEWSGSSPASLDTISCTFLAPDLCFNTDIGGVWSYTDLYLMGYVTPAEMDAGNSESRSMDDTCASPYSGTITSFNSSNITATNGDRVPDAAASQHSFRTAWICFYQPGDPPSAGELQRVADITTKWTQLWNFSSLGRGFNDNAVLPPFVFSGVAPGLFVPTLDTVNFNVQVTDSAGTHNTSSGLLNYSVEGAAYTAAPVSSLGGGLYEASLPPLPCEKRINYYVTFQNSAGTTTISEPIGSSSTPFTAVSVSSDSLLFTDDFETDQGWTVGFTGDNATTGIWTRVNPNGTGAQPEDDNDTGSGTLCYITGQGTAYPGGVLGENDVDGGRTSLVSPVFDLTGKNGVVRYARWYSNNAGATPGTDRMTVTISNNNGVSYPETLEVVAENQLGWVVKQFVVGNYIAPTNQMKVRFEASDLGAGSLVEAGVDDVEFYAIPVSALPGDANASGTYTLGDVIQTVNYIFNKPGCTPQPICWLSGLLCRGDWNGSGTVTLGDVIQAVNFIFNKPGGPWNAIPVLTCCKSL